MYNKKGKNILVINGVLHGHFPGTVEIVKQLVSLGHNVTCYVLDEFVDRIKNVGAKIIEYTIDRSKFKNPPPGLYIVSFTAITITKSYDSIITLISKDENRYDYLVIDSFFDYEELIKFFKYPPFKVILIWASFCLTYQEINRLQNKRLRVLNEVNKKYNINIRDYIYLNYCTRNCYYKLLLTSKYFHPTVEKVDSSFFFIGPSIEERKIDETFNFKKDQNKKLIYVSLGTIFNQKIDFYKLCIDTFKDSEKYQVLMSIGKYNDIKLLGVIPSNFFVFNYVPQKQVLKMADFFVTHGGLNSTNEGIFSGLPLIVIPQNFDQYDVGQLVSNLGAGITLDKDNLTIDILKDAINNIENNREQYKNKVEKIAQSFNEDRNKRKEIFEKIFI